MKIRHPLVIKTIGFVAACIIRLWVGTLRYRYRSASPGTCTRTARLHGPVYLRVLA